LERGDHGLFKKKEVTKQSNEFRGKEKEYTATGGGEKRKANEKNRHHFTTARKALKEIIRGRNIW